MRGSNCGNGADVLYGSHSRAQKSKIWGRDQGVILSRYILPQMRGLQERKNTDQSIRAWIDVNLPRLSDLSLKGSRQQNYVLDDQEKFLLKALVRWLQRPAAPPINHWSPLDNYSCLEDLIDELDFASR